jgi:hypothetical protein
MPLPHHYLTVPYLLVLALTKLNSLAVLPSLNNAIFHSRKVQAKPHSPESTFATCGAPLRFPPSRTRHTPHTAHVSGARKLNLPKTLTNLSKRRKKLNPTGAKFFATAELRGGGPEEYVVYVRRKGKRTPLGARESSCESVRVHDSRLLIDDDWVGRI